MESQPPGQDRLLDLLDEVSRQDGPVRLFPGRGRSEERGLLPNATGSNARLLEELLGSLLEETARRARRPRRVVLTPEGLRFLLKHRSPADRAARVRRSSPLYREGLLRAWKELAAPGEADLFRECLEELYGDLFDPRTGEALSDAGAFKRAMAKELVLSWNRADHPAARVGLARAMVSLGLREIGSPGDQTTFSGLIHLSEESLFKGDPVEVLEPGWSVTDEAGELLLQKAKVKPRS